PDARATRPSSATTGRACCSTWVATGPVGGVGGRTAGGPGMGGTGAGAGRVRRVRARARFTRRRRSRGRRRRAGLRFFTSSRSIAGRGELEGLDLDPGGGLGAGR